MNKLLCWALLALVSGCTGEVWRADSRFTTEERAAIDQAAEAWEAVGHPILVAHGHHVTGLESTRRYIVKTTRRAVGGIHQPLQDSGAAGKHVVEPGREMILLVMDQMKGGTPLWQIIAHEMGHSLDMNHVDDERAIMYHSGSRNSLRCITSVDIQEMCRAQGCESVPKGCDE